MSTSYAKLKAQRQEGERNKPWGYELHQVEIEYPPEMASALESNAPPSEDAVRATKAYRQDPTKALRGIESRFSIIDKEIENLRKEKESLYKVAGPHLTKLRACDTILSPIRRVPFDVIREITLYSLPLHPSPDRYGVPLSVSHVCSAWRTVALSTPHLWSTLFLQISDIDQFPTYETLVGEWFQRAKGLPLSFFIHFSIEPDNSDKDIVGFKSLLRSFAPFIPHVRHLGIGAACVGDVLPLFLNMAPDWDLRNLDRLDLSSPDSTFYNDDDGPNLAEIAPVIIFKQAPLLQKLAVKNAFVTNYGVSTVMPWFQLTNVHISEGLPADFWIQIMELSPQMRIGNFYITDFVFEYDFLPEPTLEHLHLEDLRLEFLYNYPHPVNLIKLFNLPKLRILHLFHSEVMRSNDLPSLKGLPQFSSLRVLFLQTWPYPVHYLIGILQEAVNLEKLELGCDVAIYPLLLDSLTYRSPGTILPRLSTLVLTSFSYQFLNNDNFFDMVKSRCLDGPSDFEPLACLSVSFRSSSTAKIAAAQHELKDKLRSCVESGLILDTQDIHASERLGYVNSGICAFDGWRPGF